MSKEFSWSHLICKAIAICGALLGTMKFDPSSDKVNDLSEPVQKVSSLLQQVAANGRDHNPRCLLEAANIVLSQKEAQAMEILTLITNVDDATDIRRSTAVKLLLQLIFEIDQRQTVVQMDFGEPMPSRPQSSNYISLFPLLIVDDIPFVVTRGYTVIGEPLRSRAYFDYYVKHGKLRKKTFRPTNDPLGVIDRAMCSEGWRFGLNLRVRDAEAIECLLRLQLLRTIGHDREDDLVKLLRNENGCQCQVKTLWLTMLKIYSDRNFSWSDKMNRYDKVKGNKM